MYVCTYGCTWWWGISAVSCIACLISALTHASSSSPYPLRKWLWHEGSVVSVQGDNFVTGQTYCRLGELSDRVHATVVDRKNLHCKVGANTQLNSESKLPLLYVSNDGGNRWVSGLLGVHGAVRWFNTSLNIPSTVFSNYTVIHVAAIVPGLIASARTPALIDGLQAGAAFAEQGGIFPPGVKVRVHVIESELNVATVVAATESLLRRFPDIVGLVGDEFSSTTIPLAFKVSLPRRLPMISYGAWTGAVGSKSALPYFLRTCVSNTNLANELNHLFGAFQWRRYGVHSFVIERQRSHSLLSHHRISVRTLCLLLYTGSDNLLPSCAISSLPPILPPDRG